MKQVWNREKEYKSWLQCSIRDARSFALWILTSVSCKLCIHRHAVLKLFTSWRKRMVVACVPPLPLALRWCDNISLVLLLTSTDNSSKVIGPRSGRCNKWMTPSSGIVNVLDAIDAYPCGSSSLSSSLPLNNQLNNPELVVLRKPLSLKIVLKKTTQEQV